MRFVSIFCFCTGNGKIVSICTNKIRAYIAGACFFRDERSCWQSALYQAKRFGQCISFTGSVSLSAMIDSG